MKIHFSPKCIRSFLEYIKPDLFSGSHFKREFLCERYNQFVAHDQSPYNYPVLKTVNDRIEFINTITDIDGIYSDYDRDTNTPVIHISVDPVEVKQWYGFLNSLYQDTPKTRLLEAAPRMYEILKSIQAYSESNYFDTNIKCDIEKILTIIDTGKALKI